MANILIIEDSQSLCRLYQSILGRLGHDVTLARTGEAGIAEAARIPPDLVILDLLLPEMSGAEVAQELRRAGKSSSVPMIITTAMGDRYARAVTASVGPATLLLKPFEINALLTLVNDIWSASDHPPPSL